MRKRLIVGMILAAALTWPGGPALAEKAEDALAETAPADENVRIVLLGTGTPNAVPERMGPATAIVIGGQAYIVDAGVGLVRRAAEAARDHGIDALLPERLDRLFLTHLHSDHTIGLADILLTSWVAGRSQPLAIFGPPGSAEMVDNLTRAYGADIRIRIDGSQPQNATGYFTEVTQVGDGFIYEDDNAIIEAHRVCHGEIRDSFAYKFIPKGGGRTVFVSGDTTLCPALTIAARGSDVLVQEVYSDEGFTHLPDDWKAYHAAHHTSAADVARLANAARVELVILTHQLSWGDVPHESILGEVRAGTDVPVAFGRDLDVY